jgi:hypothetical protein
LALWTTGRREVKIVATEGRVDEACAYMRVNVIPSRAMALRFASVSRE